MDDIAEDEDTEESGDDEGDEGEEPQDLFEVKAILASRLRRTQGLLVKELKVQWADSPEGKSCKDSWEPIEGLSQCSTIFSDFLQKEADEKKKKKEDKSKNNRTQISYYKDYEHKQTQQSLDLGKRRLKQSTYVRIQFQHSTPWPALRHIPHTFQVYPYSFNLEL